jgi:hypothetical protein
VKPINHFNIVSLELCIQTPALVAVDERDQAIRRPGDQEEYAPSKV